MHNQITLIGNIGKDPETKVFDSGARKTSFSIAVSETRKNKDTGEKEESVQWFSIETWQKLSEIVSQYCKKGDRVFVQGRMLSSKYTDDNNQEKERFFVNCQTLKMLSAKKDNDNRGNNQQSQQTPLDQTGQDDDLPF